MSSTLFSDFKANDLQDWIAALNKELKGKDYREALVHENLAGISISPVYPNTLEFAHDVTGKFPYRRGAGLEGNPAGIIERVDVGTDVQKANAAALEALMAGADHLRFQGDFDIAQLGVLMKDIRFDCIGVTFSGHAQPLALYDAYLNLALQFEYDLKALRLLIAVDPLRDVLEGKNASDLSAYVKKLRRDTPFVQGFEIDLSLVQEAGMNPVHELVYALAAGNHYLNVLVEAGFTVDEAAAQLSFRTALGPDFFLEIAKIRALRVLWSNVVRAWKPTHACSANTRIDAVNSMLYMAAADVHTNLLRATSAAFAAWTAGANHIEVLPYDAAIEEKDPSAKRYARNISLLLRDESHLNEVADPAGGSMYVEYLSNSLSEKAWKIFQQCDREGGVQSWIDNGKWQSLASADFAVLSEKMEKTELRMIGVNKYPNKNEKAFTPSKLKSLPGAKLMRQQLALLQPKTV
jgi:methylmalonyl-CoA mutase